jgi:hypothetical protein
MACRTFGRPKARVERFRLGDDGQVYRDAHVYDDLDLDAFELELRERLLGAPADPTDLHLGEWCRYCPSFAVCPAQASLAVQLAHGQLLDEQPGELLPLTPERAGLAWLRLRAVKQLVAHVERAVIATLDQNGGTLPLPDGREVRRLIKPGNERLDGIKVFEAVAELYGPKVAEKAVEMSATKTGIRDALRPLDSKRGALSKAEAAVLAKVRAAGGATRKPTTSIEEVEAP